VETEISSTPNMFFSDLEESIDGVSEFRPTSDIDISWAEVLISRDFIDDPESEKWFYFGLKNGQSFTKVYRWNDSITFDTAKVLGRQYVDVIKFRIDSLSPRSFKTIYFAKKYGFIKIETYEGYRIERMLPSN
jgi:hypothetical protein